MKDNSRHQHKAKIGHSIASILGLDRLQHCHEDKTEKPTSDIKWPHYYHATAYTTAPSQYLHHQHQKQPQQHLDPYVQSHLLLLENESLRIRLAEAEEAMTRLSALATAESRTEQLSPPTSNPSSSSSTSSISSPLPTPPPSRSRYSPRQVLLLRARYESSRHLNRQQMSELATDTGLTTQQVKVWFQNRRLADKKRKKPVDKNNI